MDEYLSTDTDSDERMYIFNTMWEQIDEKIQVLQTELNAKIFEDLVEFVRTSHDDVNPSKFAEKTRHEIPTAALVTGVNMTDHAAMFSNLSNLLRENVTSHVAVLKSKDCHNLKAMLATVISQLMDNPYIDGEDEDDVCGHQINLRRVSCSMSTIKSWYSQASKRVLSPRKQKCSPRKFHGNSTASLSNHSRNPIAIILEDFEGFSDCVVQDFITVCSYHLDDLPLVLVFGIATSVAAVHKLLPHKVSSLLCMEKFQAPPSSEYLNHVLMEVSMNSNVPFKLNGKVFRLLLDLFLYHDFSVLNFTRSLQFCMLDHYYSNPISILCQPISEIEGVLESLTPHQVETIRSSASFRRFVEKNSPSEQILLLEDESYTKTTILKCMGNLDHYHTCLFPVLSCLHIFVKKLPRYPLGKQLRELYSTFLLRNVCDSQDYTDALDLLKTVSRDEILCMLTQSCECLANTNYPDDIHSIREELISYKEKLELVTTLTVINPDEDVDDPQDLMLPRKMDMSTLKKKLQAMEHKKKLSPYENLREEFFQFLDNVFRKYLRKPSELLLNEALYYSDTNELHRHINGCPRATIQQGLTNPHYYLEHDHLKSEGGIISPTLPDLSIVYKLHLECGKMINLYDWLQAFITIVSPEDESVTNDQRKPDRKLQARFIRAVSELQFLGFIKPTKRKTDHVARLTWGGC